MDRLAEYRKKRSFDKTPEPTGGERHDKAIFVVQEHHASHLHWDLRLEMDDVLRSWAVPKEPPTKPGIKRLAVMTEDHPLGYADFEGVIEEGQYGAGTVEIWDKGGLEVKHRDEEKIEFTLHGRKLKGDFVLIRFARAGPRNWLFFMKG
jgi:DNA ligase D-like protein (predicted 3'-phosphoesterase)